MALRIVDAELQLDSAMETLEATFAKWAGGRSDQWQADGKEGPRESGTSYARREDVDHFVHRRPRATPAGVGAGGDGFLLISVEELKRQNIRDPLRRLAGAPQIKRANVADRDYVLLGPLEDVRVAEALLALAGLNPLFERHIERLGALAVASDERDEAELYRASPRVARQHRIHAKVVQALFEHLHGLGFEVEELKNGPYRADFAMRRRDLAIAFEIRAAAELEDVLKSLGQLMLAAPKSSGFHRCMVLPAPREALGSVLEPFTAAFSESGVLLLMYDFKERAFVFWPQVTPAGFPPELARMFG